MKLNFSQARVLVVGDVMLDQYYEGTSSRISPEAPVPVVNVNSIINRIGGAGNVARNIAALGAEPSLVGILGNDDAGNQLVNLLEQSNINNQCVIDDSVQTITKLRVLAQHQQLIRLDFEETHAEIQQDKILEHYENTLDNCDLVVLSDYGKGVLSEPQNFIQLAQKYSVRVVIDPKKNNFEVYAGSWLLTPNLKEFEAVVGHTVSNEQREELAQAQIDQHQLGGILLTLGDKGMMLVMDQQAPVYFATEAKDVYDVTGAGDTVIASIATAVASGLDIQQAIRIACRAAAIVVGKVGTAVASVEELNEKALSVNTSSQLLKNKILDQEKCLEMVAQLKQRKQKIVFTNGCFDLLHAGHVSYLAQAADQGDFLVVAVNSDDSVKGLKGDSRPINSLTDRMNVLAALSSVDMIVPFAELTPEDLIKKMLPNILVKGSDYKIEEIAGHQYVESVVLIDLVEGKSSSSMLDKIKQN